MEKESDEIEKIASGASNPNDLKRSQQLAVILLFTRQKVMEVTRKWEEKKKESDDLRRECKRKQVLISTLQKRVKELNDQLNQMNSDKRDPPNQPTNPPKRSRLSISKMGSFRNTLFNGESNDSVVHDYYHHPK
ncbi:hypothetical protein WA538_004017 [Blastocystis sp. DL]